MTCRICTDLADLARAVAEGAGAALITEEASEDDAGSGALWDWVSAQQSWSDFPFIVLAKSRSDLAQGARAPAWLNGMGNVALLERPVGAAGLASAANAALRTRRKQYEVRASLAERELAAVQLAALNGDLQAALDTNRYLLQELQHRVKNHIGIITSLVRMRARSTTSESARAELGAVGERVDTLRLLHEQLYVTGTADRLRLRPYVTRLVENLSYLHADQSGKVRLDFAIADVELGPDAAVPLGLIVNEFVTNSLKYAFDGHVARSGFAWRFCRKTSCEFASLMTAKVCQLSHLLRHPALALG